MPVWQDAVKVNDLTLAVVDKRSFPNPVQKWRSAGQPTPSDLRQIAELAVLGRYWVSWVIE
jgi:hypothetical protein